MVAATVEWKPLSADEKKNLMGALRRNAEDNHAVLMGEDTTFAGVAEEIPDEEVISAIRSVPTHYAQ